MTETTRVSRRTFLAGTAATVAAATPLTALARRRDARPNVLLLMSDEHSPHALHCDGNDLIRTPSLDSLAEQGVLFRSAYCQNPICVPSRVSMITGKMPSHVGVFGNNDATTEQVTMARSFRQVGYSVGWLGKEHWVTKDVGFGDTNKPVLADQRRRCQAARDFRKKIERLPHDAAVSPFPVENDDDTVTTDHALDFLEAHRDGPFFLGVSYRKPHFPFECQQRFLDLYRGRTGAPRVTEAMLEDLCLSSKKEREKYRFDELTADQVEFARAMYFGMVTYIDEQIGRVLSTLDRLGLRDDTIILYTSDHGELAGEHGLWYKNSFYEGAASVPFVWSFPKRLPRNRKIDAHVMNMDIYPTLCELCELPTPDGLEGSSFLPVMTGDEDGSDRIALSENYRNGIGGRMIRRDRWKYCWYDEGPDQLYDLAEDPAEERNLATQPQHAELVAELKAQVLAGYLPRRKNK